MFIRHHFSPFFSLFFFNDTATTEIYTLSLHDALPICTACKSRRDRTHQARIYEGSRHWRGARRYHPLSQCRSEEHTSELQSHVNLVCRLLLEKKKKNKNN